MALGFFLFLFYLVFCGLSANTVSLVIASFHLLMCYVLFRSLMFCVSGGWSACKSYPESMISVCMLYANSHGHAEVGE